MLRNLYYLPFRISARFVYRNCIRPNTTTAASAASRIVGPTHDEDESFIEMDTEKLRKYCCVNYVKGGEDVELKPDSDYPPWLYELRLGPPPELDDLDPNYYPYWQKIKQLKEQQMEARKYVRFRSGHVQRYNLARGDMEVFGKRDDVVKELH